MAAMFCQFNFLPFKSHQMPLGINNGVVIEGLQLLHFISLNTSNSYSDVIVIVIVIFYFFPQ